jgi:hypothetical protein
MTNGLRISELERRVQMDPASIAFAALAEEYRRDGRLEEAIATCSAGLRRHPCYLSAHVTLARACVGLGRIADGRAEFERVLRLAPENLAAIRGLAEIHSMESAAEQNEPSLALTNSIPQHTGSEPPALVGLEHFLGAISRARGANPGLVSLGR